MSDIELKPCPFCGVRPEYAHDYFNGRGDCVYAVACSNMECPMEAIADGNGTKEDAIRIWNTRAPLTPPEGYVLIKTSTLSGLADDAEALIVQTEFREGRRDMRLASVREAREAMNSNQEAVVK